MRSFYRTKAGTELALLNLRGKEYLQCQQRVIWFLEEKPGWSIQTKFLRLESDHAVAHATIRDETGRVRATGTKFENEKGFPDFIEKAETGAIGRALALCGHGTQFCADELDEGERLADAPVEPKAGTNTASIETRIEYGITTNSKWPFTYPDGLKTRAIATFGSDELVMAESQLIRWKTGKSKASYPKEGDAYLAALRSRMPEHLVRT